MVGCRTTNPSTTDTLSQSVHSREKVTFVHQTGIARGRFYILRIDILFIPTFVLFILSKLRCFFSLSLSSKFGEILDIFSMFGLYFHRTSVRLTTRNMFRLMACFLPRNAEDCAKMCLQGFEDALRFLTKNGK